MMATISQTSKHFSQPLPLPRPRLGPHPPSPCTPPPRPRSAPRLDGPTGPGGGPPPRPPRIEGPRGTKWPRGVPGRLPPMSVVYRCQKETRGRTSEARSRRTLRVALGRPRRARSVVRRHTEPSWAERDGRSARRGDRSGSVRERRGLSVRARADVGEGAVVRSPAAAAAAVPGVRRRAGSGGYLARWSIVPERWGRARAGWCVGWRRAVVLLRRVVEEVRYGEASSRNRGEGVVRR